MFGRPKYHTSSSDKQLLEQFAFDSDGGQNGWLKAVLSFIVETIKVFILAAAIILPIRYFLIQPFYVKGASMEPNFYDHEYLMINEISYRFAEPERGDIAVFRFPRDPKQFFIKRIVGMPGETLEIKNGDVLLYDPVTNKWLPINESWYLSDDVVTAVNGQSGHYTLADDEFLLFGDNRTHSLDSRNFGPVKKSLIIGKVWFRGWPLDRIKLFN